MVAAAIGASAAGSLISGGLQASAAGSASAAQVAAQQQAIAAQEKYFGIGKGELQPFQTEGVAAGGQLSSLLGLGAGGTAGALSTLQSLPGYQFTLGQAQQAQAAGITARGLGLSGAQLRGASDYAQGAAQTNYNNYSQQLYQLMGLGEQAGQGIANAASTVGTGIASNEAGIGNAQAAGILGSTAGITNAIGGLTSAGNTYAGYQQYLALQSAIGGAYSGSNPTQNTPSSYTDGNGNLIGEF